MSEIVLEQVTKRYGRVTAVEEMSFRAEPPESGVDWSVISAGTLMAVAPLVLAFLLFQRQFMQSFMHAGIK